jgi:2-amino-4-hydroxy-6-hydroxymethyldihydropteridine diphosphokinase
VAIVLVGLGSNVGDRVATLEHALEKLREQPAIDVAAVSTWFETRPAGGPSGQGAFLNGAALLETSLSPSALLALLKQIEADLGRQPDRRWAARPIDLDVLLYEGLVCESPQLSLPHPRMAWRRFVLEPAAQIAAELLHPTSGWTIERLLAHLDGSPPYVALAGPIGAGKTQLARRLAEQSGVRWLAESVDAERLTRFYGDPASQAVPMELEFVEHRAAMLTAGDEAWRHGLGYTISDFWYNQSRAFARVWLDAESFARFEPQWQSRRANLVAPRLLVLLDIGAAEAMRRIRQRNRPYEQQLGAVQWQRLRQSLLDEVARPDVGPVMRLNEPSLESAAAEVVAAMESMQR